MFTRKKFYSLILTGGAALLAHSALVIADEPATAATAVGQDHYPPQQAQYPAGVVSLGNLTYSSLDGFRPLTLDLYMPAGKVTAATAGRPLVVYIHGGGWSGGTSRNAGAFIDFPSVLAALAAKGYVVASLNYRLSHEAPFPAAIQDVKASIQWLRGHAGEYGIDKSRAMVWGGSAGGQLAGLAATSCGVTALAPPPPRMPPGAVAHSAGPAPTPESDCVQGAVLWYPVLDFDTLIQGQLRSNPNMPADNATGRYLGCALSNCPAETIRLASAFSMIGPTTPPILLIHGTEDHTVPPAQSQTFYDKLKAANGKTELVMIPDVDHSFIGKTLESTHQASILALNKTFAFIDATIGKKAN